MGIHNESGYRRLSPIPPLSELMPQLLELLTSTSDHERSFVPFKGNDDIVLLVNNLGGVSSLELGAIVREACKAAEAKGFEILRLFSGTFMVGDDSGISTKKLQKSYRPVSTCPDSRSPFFACLQPKS
jgi:dihydroxyacetone kinase